MKLKQAMQAMSYRQSLFACRQGTAALSHKIATVSLADNTSAAAAQHSTQPQAARPSGGGAEQEGDKGMSKSQAKRIRKKKREAKV